MPAPACGRLAGTDSIVVGSPSSRSVGWLARNDTAPGDLIAFLDHATERVLLHRIGGGYLFIHQLLFDHFVSLYSQRQHQVSLPRS